MFDTPYLFSKVSKKDKTTQSLNLLAYFHCMSLKSTSPALICGHDQTFAHVQLFAPQAISLDFSAIPTAQKP